MRRKIAKRKRREILAKGGVITKEGWLGPKSLPRKENGYEVEVRHNGWRIWAADYDELSSFHGILSAMEVSEEEHLENGTIVAF